MHINYIIFFILTFTLMVVIYNSALYEGIDIDRSSSSYIPYSGIGADDIPTTDTDTDELKYNLDGKINDLKRNIRAATEDISNLDGQLYSSASPPAKGSLKYVDNRDRKKEQQALIKKYTDKIELYKKVKLDYNKSSYNNDSIRDQYGILPEKSQMPLQKGKGWTGKWPPDRDVIKNMTNEISNDKKVPIGYDENYYKSNLFDALKN